MCWPSAVQASPTVWNGQTIPVSFAYGAFELKPGDNADMAMARADEAMYAQKQREQERQNKIGWPGSTGS